MKRFLLAASAMLTMCCGTMAQETTPFEGEMMYENTVTSSKGMQRLFPSLLKDGSYEMQFVIKGNVRKVSDTYAGLIQYENRIKDMAYVYCPLLKKGFKYKISKYEKQQEEKYGEASEGKVTKTGEVKEIEGLKCHHFKGDYVQAFKLLGSEITVTCNIDYWACLDFAPEWMGSVKIEGMPALFDEMQIATFPLLGSQKQHQNVTLTEVKKRPVDNTELTPPSDVEFTLSDDPLSSLGKLQKEISKYIKKNNLIDTGVKIHHGKIEEEVLDDAWD